MARFFSTNKHAVQYRQEELEACGVSQAVLVCLAVLLGCDYTGGVRGVGIDTALSILSTSYKVQCPEWKAFRSQLKISELVVAWLSRWRELVEKPLPPSWGEGDEYMSPAQYSRLCDYYESWRSLVVEPSFPPREVIDAFCCTPCGLSASRISADRPLNSVEWSEPRWDQLRQYAAVQGVFTAAPYLLPQMEHVRRACERDAEERTTEDHRGVAWSTAGSLTDSSYLVRMKTDVPGAGRLKCLSRSLCAMLELLRCVQEKGL